jgi:hypothetical protein
MCDIGIDEPCQVWDVRAVHARKRHRCCECGAPIVPGTAYVRVGALFDGCWATYRSHADCEALVKFIAFDVCGQPYYGHGLERLRDRVREHMDESPEVLRMYRAALRSRAREQGWQH